MARRTEFGRWSRPCGADLARPLAHASGRSNWGLKVVYITLRSAPPTALREPGARDRASFFLNPVCRVSRFARALAERAANGLRQALRVDPFARATRAKGVL